MIQGEKRPEFARKVGVFTGEVVAINPDAAKIAELYKMDAPPEKEPEYTSEKDTEVPDHVEDGAVVKVTKTVKNARIDIYIQDTKTQSVTKKSFFLSNQPFVKKDMSKQQYINSQGKTAWVDDAANLPKKFTHFVDKQGNTLEDIPYHTTVQGEGELIEFVDTWIALDKKKSFDLSISTENMFKGNFRELQGLVNSDLSSLIMGVYTVRAVDGEQGVQFYQDMWKKFLPAFTIKFFQQIDFTPEKLKEITDKDIALRAKISGKEQITNADWLANWEKFAMEITGEYGCKDSFSLKMAHDFDPETHYATRAATIDQTSNEY